MNESDIQNFWQNHPCGEAFAGGADRFRNDAAAFFKAYDDYRYGKEPHILKCLDGIDFDGRKTLEIGLGQGADAEQIVRRGADWYGLDLTHEAALRTNIRMEIKSLPTGRTGVGSALEIPFGDRRFDLVFCHGVLHHIPEIIAAQAEIKRVLTPDGELIAMLYARDSLNYRLSICLLRRLGLLVAYYGGIGKSGIVAEHVGNARQIGIGKYLRMENFLHKNTDGPRNPYSKVYDLDDVRSDFPDFEISRSYKRFMHAPPLPVSGLPGESIAGWHLWVHLKPGKPVTV